MISGFGTTLLSPEFAEAGTSVAITPSPTTDSAPISANQRS